MSEQPLPASAPLVSACVVQDPREDSAWLKTQLMLAEAERAAQHEMFMQAPMAIAILEGPAHTFTFANPAYRALVNGRDVLGKPLLVALPDLEGQGFDTLLEQVVSSGQPFFGKELPIKLEHHGEGEVLFMNFTYTAKRNAHGVNDGVMVSGSDVTEQVRARHRAEALSAQVRASEAELRFVTDALPVLLSFVDADERYRFANRAYEEWFGVSRQSLIGQTVQQVVGQAAYEKLRPFVMRGLAGERFSFEQHDVPYRLGGDRDIRVSFVPQVNEDGVVSGYVALLEDITSQRRAAAELNRQGRELARLLEQTQASELVNKHALMKADLLNLKLAAAEDVLRNLVNNLPELAWSAEADGDIDFFNQRWFDYTGASLPELKGTRWQSRVDPAVLPDMVPRWRTWLEKGEPFEMEFPLRRADGEYRWFLTRVQPLRDGSGTIVRWFGVNADIHEQREVGRRAEEASRAKDEFLATASHELRTPLNAILGWARMLRSGQVDPSGYARGLETIERNAKAQVQLIEDILDGSRIITGKLHLEIRPLDLTDLVRAALDAVRPAADAKGISLTLELDPEAARVVGDPERLQQVVWNLANNAVKFTPRGGAVELRLTRSGTHIELAVSDSGQGISSQFLPHVFDRFRQAEGSSSRRHGGLGLGLALVRHLVEAHGGTVHAESGGEGQGSRFSVLLPVQAVYQAPEGPDRPRITPTEALSLTSTPLSLEGVSILVVDDEVDARELVAVVLRARGAEVTTAPSAVEALELLAKVVPRVVISDIGMPEVDGYEFMRRVRHQTGAHGAAIPAIALTAYSREQDRRLALQAGFQTHVAKPVEPAELVRVVAALVSFVDPDAPPQDREIALEKADSFLKFGKILSTQGIQEALRFLNSRTAHRYTAIYRFDEAMLRNVKFVDSFTPEIERGDDAPLSHTYCSIVGQIRAAFTTEDTRRDDRLRAHPARDTVISYCGVLLRDAAGNPYGTLCHFDSVPCEIPVREMTLLEAAAPLLMAELLRK